MNQEFFSFRIMYRTLRLTVKAGWCKNTKTQAENYVESRGKMVYNRSSKGSPGDYPCPKETRIISVFP